MNTAHLIAGVEPIIGGFGADTVFDDHTVNIVSAEPGGGYKETAGADLVVILYLVYLGHPAGKSLLYTAGTVEISNTVGLEDQVAFHDAIAQRWDPSIRIAVIAGRAGMERVAFFKLGRLDHFIHIGVRQRLPAGLAADSACLRRSAGSFDPGVRKTFAAFFAAKAAGLGRAAAGFLPLMLAGAAGKDNAAQKYCYHKRNNLFHMLTFLRLYLMAKFMIP